MAERTCLTCGASISDRPMNARYCRACCEYRRSGGRRGTLTGKPVLHSECGTCGTKYTEPQIKQFCSTRCRAIHAGSTRFLTEMVRTCTACGQSFTTTNSRRQECSRACVSWRYLYPGVPRTLDKECRYCLTPFHTWTPKQKYCTSACGQATDRMRRRARQADSFMEEVSKGVVAARDKWRCQLCRKKVDKRLRYPHPMSWSLDHIIPISRGGEHSYANTQLAHLVCNIRKHATTRAPQQLALIG